MGQRPQTEAEWLIVAQHHRVPTALLDWTASPLVALYFACSGDTEHDGIVFALDTIGTPKYETSTMYVNLFGEGDHPFAIIPARAMHTRAMVQQSVVTLHRGTGADWFKGLPGAMLKSYTIPAAGKAETSQALEILGIDEKSLMADLPTVAEVFRRSIAGN
jgi:hypothetical protein